MKQQNIMLNQKTILVTGAAGFIGANLVMKLLSSVSFVHIVGVDNINAYYDVAIKEYRLKQIRNCSEKYRDSNWTFIKGNIADRALMDRIFDEYQPAIVVNLAAQAGVRYSIIILLAFITFWNYAAILMKNGSMEWNIWCMLRLLLYMEQIRKFHFLLQIK